LSQDAVVILVGLICVTVLVIVRMFVNRPRCKHQWDVRARVVAEPVEMELLPVGRMSRESFARALATFERLNTGRTSVVLTCGKCGAIETRRIEGQPDQGGTDLEKSTVQP